MHQFSNSREEREYLDKLEALRNGAPPTHKYAADQLGQTVAGPIPIPAAVESLRQSIEQLGKAVAALTETLGPFLAPEEAIGAAPTPNSDPVGQAPLTADILKAEASIIAMRHWLTYLTDRVCA